MTLHLSTDKNKSRRKPRFDCTKAGTLQRYFWTETKNALTELIYALHASGAISYGKISVRKISLMFQILFGITLNDIHHTFHRMKTKSGSRTAFLDELKVSLEEYMDKDL
nr:RteC domain-containing protein [Elizabethkingia bruuniana]